MLIKTALLNNKNKKELLLITQWFAKVPFLISYYLLFFAGDIGTLRLIVPPKYVRLYFYL